MPGAFLYQDRVTAGTVISAQASVGSMPVTNLQDAQPRRRVRLMGNSASIVADLGADVPVDCAALISTTLDAGATVRARLGSEAALVEAAPIINLDFMAATPSSMAQWSAARGGGGGTGEATYLDASGNLIQAAAGEWRIDHDPLTLVRRGLLVEPQSTNVVRNSRAEGAVVGTPGTAPNLWQVSGNGAGLNWNIAAIGTEAGFPYLDVRISGTSSSLAAASISFDTLLAAAAINQNWTASLYIRRVSGSLTGLASLGLLVRQYNASSVLLGAIANAVDASAAVMRTSRQACAATLSQAGTAFVDMALQVAPQIGVAVDCTFRIAAPQLEQKPWPTSVIFNPSGAPGATTRQADSGTLLYSVPSEFTLFSDLRHAVVPMGASLTFFARVSATGDNNSFVSYDSYGAGGVQFTRAYALVNASAIASFPDSASTAGQISTQVFGYAPNNMAYSINGGAAQLDNSGVLDTMRGLALFAQGDSITHIRQIRLYGQRLTNAQIVALSGTGSSLLSAEVLADTGILNAQASAEGMGNVVLTLPAPVTARYLRVDVVNGAAAFTDIGRLVAGQLWRLQRGTAYGITEGRVMLDRRDRNPYTGAEFPVPAIANPRFASFTLPSLSTAEARNQHRELVRLLGAARDGLWIAELTDTLAERNRRAIWGAINLPGEDAGVTRNSLPLSSRSFRITERL